MNWPESVQRLDVLRAKTHSGDGFPSENIEGRDIDAAICDLKTMVKTERNLTTSAHQAENAKQKALDEQRHRAEQAEAEAARLKDGLVRIVQCRYHNLTIEDENGQHVVDAYYAPDVLAIVHEVFPDFSAWNESRWAEREKAR